MQAITVQPGRAASVALEDVPEPPKSDGPVLVSTLSVGICGTDIEILSGDYGWAPARGHRLVLGHEAVGRVIDAPSSSPIQAGDLVVGIVRRPDPVPCLNCAVGEYDMCRNGRYTERGIKQLDGYASERFRIVPEYAVRLDPRLAEVGALLEPASVVVKAWVHIERFGSRARWRPRTLLVTGAGPIGLLAALLGAQRGLNVHVLDRVTEGPKVDLVKQLGGTYHVGRVQDSCPEPDIVIECSGAAAVAVDVMSHSGTGAVVCLTGVTSPGRRLAVDAGALNRELVLENDVVFGTVSANRLHYEQAADALRDADLMWLRALVTRVPLDRWKEAFERQPTDVKTVVDFPSVAPPA